MVTKRLSVLKDRKYTIAFISWMVFITFSSLFSFEDTDTSRFNIPHLDKAVHFIFYFVAAVLATFFVRESTKGIFPLYKTLWSVVLGAIIFGMIIEVFQHTFTTDREADLFDALANSLGAISGTLVMKSFFSSETRLKWKN